MSRPRRRKKKDGLKIRTVWAFLVLGGAGWLTEPLASWPEVRLGTIAFLELVVGIALPWWLLFKILMWLDWKFGSGRRMREEAGLQKRRRIGGLILRTRVRFGKPNRHLRANFSQNGMTSVSAQLANGVVWNSGTGKTRFDLWGPFSWETRGRYRPQLQGRGRGKGQRELAPPKPQWQPIPGKPGEQVMWIPTSDGRGAVPVVRREKEGPRGGRKTQWGVNGNWYDRQTDAFMAVAAILRGESGEPVPSEVADPTARYPWEDGWNENQQAAAAQATQAYDARRK